MVAAITTISFLTSKPSNSVKNCDRTFSDTPESVVCLPLLGAIESNSSKKIIHGAAIFAFRKISRIAFSLSPTYLDSNSGPLIEIKLALLSCATALAKSVFPHPGGPYNKIPLGGFIPIRSKIFGCDKGQSTASISFCFNSSNPPI